MADPRLRSVPAETYERHGELARGGLGRIMRARDVRLGRPVALKELLHETPEDRARFLREVRLTARLQHPSIVPVYEAGTWPTGETFYVMKLVSGAPLSTLIGQTRSLAERLALLTHVIAVAEAMAYAHSERIIHRDLKPANILVGQFGETVVIDWGLGKHLDETDADAPGAADGGAGGAATVAGTVLGTPVYMPPEQANGLPCDERADVYALGATLYHLLSGALPYKARSSAEVLGLVVAGPPASLESRGVEAPRDLLTIVEKAMARDPAARYPTARELAEDLRRFTTGQLVRAHEYSLGALLRRFVRRHRAPVIVAGALLAVLLAGGALAVNRIVGARERATHEREVAVRQRQAAERVIHFVVTDLRDRLEPLGKLAVLGRLAGEVTTYYDSVTGDDASEDDAAELRRAAALAVLGEVTQTTGDLAGAQADYRRALVIRERLWRAAPGDDRRALLVATSLNDVGKTYDWTGDIDAAQPWLDSAWGLLAGRCPRRPLDTDCLQTLAHVEKNLGDTASERGDSAGAMAWFRDALAITETLAAREPGRLELQHELASTRDWLARTQLLARDVHGALATAAENNARLLPLTRDNPLDLQLAHDLAWTYSRIGSARDSLGDTAGARDAYAAGLAIAERLTRSDPDDAPWMRLVSTLGDELATELRVLGEYDAAIAHERASIAILERLVSADPSNSPWREDLADARESLGAHLMENGQLPAAIDAYREAVAVATQEAARSPRNLGAQIIVASCENSLGDALVMAGDLDEARGCYQAALAIVDRHAPGDKLRGRWTLRGVDGTEGLADIAEGRGDHAAAVELYEQARARGAPIFDGQNRAVSAAAIQLRLLREELVPLVALGRADQVAAVVARGRALVAGDTDVPDIAADNTWFLAVAAGAEADLHAARGERALALIGAREAVALARAALKTSNDDSDVLTMAAGRLIGLGDAELALDGAPRAAAAYREAIALVKGSMEGASGFVERPGVLARAHAGLARASRGQEAAAELEQAIAILTTIPEVRRRASARALLADCQRRRAQLP